MSSDPYSVPYEGYKQQFLLEARLAFYPNRSHAILSGIMDSGRATAFPWSNFAAALRRRTETRLGFRYGHVISSTSNYCQFCGESRYQLVWAAGRCG